MDDRMYPSGKPANSNGGSATNGTAANGRGPPSFPATKSQVYGANRPVYRPQPPKRRRSSRSCCCSCCLWLTLFLIALVFLAAIAGAVFYFIYRPHRPTFSVTSVRLSSFNVSASNALTSRLDVTVTARNPNKKLVYVYDPITVSVDSGGVGFGDGSFVGFTHGTGNTTVMKAAVAASKQSLDATAAADLRKRTTLPLEIRLESKAGVKVGGLKTKKIGVRVTCGGVNVAVPKGKGPPPAASSPDVSCKVKLRVKIWKWYL